MLRSFQIIKEPIHYRIVNLLDKKRLSADDLQQILNIPINEIRKHLNILYQMEVISCDVTSPPDMCRISESFIKENPFFYEMAVSQMAKLPIYQEDVMHLKEFLQHSS